MMTTCWIIIACFIFCGLANGWPVPREWIDAYEKGDLVYAPALPEDIEQRPAIGSGRLATVVGSGTIYSLGGYAGTLSDPPHRASIQDPQQLSLQGPANGTALSFRSALVDERFGALQHRQYVSRARPSVFVHDLKGSGWIKNITVPSGGADFGELQWKPAPEGFLLYEMTARRAPSGVRPLKVAVCASLIPEGGYYLQDGQEMLLLTVIRSSMDSENPAEDVVQDALDAASAGAEILLHEHEAAWAKLWSAGIDVSGDLDLALAINSSMYQLYSSIRAEDSWAASPGSLATNGYNGHMFWDGETWMLPALLPLDPEFAGNFLRYRGQRISEAASKAQAFGFRGLMFPWESAQTGIDVCPWPPGLKLEQHIVADIGLAIRLWFLSTGNKTMLREQYEVLNGTAEFWLSRVQEGADGRLHINHVIGPDEYQYVLNNGTGVTDSAYTNVAVIQLMLFMQVAAEVVNEPVNPAWIDVATRLAIPFNGVMHPEFEGYAGQQAKQADVVLMSYPLDAQVETPVLINDLDYYEKHTDPNGPAMTWGIFVVNWLTAGDPVRAEALFNASFELNMNKPFYVWQETPQGGCPQFLTGAGGFLQTIMAGLGGFRFGSSPLTPGARVRKTHLIRCSELTLRNFSILGVRVVIHITPESVTLQIPDVDGSGIALVANGIPLHPGGSPVVFPTAVDIQISSA